MEIKLKYNDIYYIAELYDKHIKENKDIYLPAKLNFSIHKNFKRILEIKNEIERVRRDVALHYGVENSNGSYTIPEDNVQKAQQELNELANTEQILEIIPIAIDELDEFKFTPGQFEALEFMINTQTEENGGK